MRTPKLTFHTSLELWLSCEQFHNAGLTPEEVGEVLESLGYTPSPTRLNGNWGITLRSGEDPITRAKDIQEELEYQLWRKKVWLKCLKEIIDTLSIVERDWVPVDHLTASTFNIMELAEKGFLTNSQGLIRITPEGKKWYENNNR